MTLGMSVREAMARIDSREYAEWVAYWALEPWGETRADLRAGIVASTVANGLLPKKGGSWEAADFMPDFDADRTQPKRATQSIEDMRQILRTFVKIQNGQD